jgi:hypothetical protein
MPAVGDLLKRCTEKLKDDTAWLKLWNIVHSAVLFPVTKLLQQRGYAKGWVADVLQDLYLHLQENSWARLEAFHGTSEGELRDFLRQIAIRFANDWVQREQRHLKHEAQALHGAAPPTRDGPTEQQIENARKEVESIMTAAEREKLHAVSGQDSSPSGDPDTSASPAKRVSTRTIRRWRDELLRHYGDSI